MKVKILVSSILVICIAIVFVIIHNTQRITVQVLDEKGNPISGARVFLYSYNNFAPELGREKTTSRSGRLTMLIWNNSKDYLIQATKPGFLVNTVNFSNEESIEKSFKVMLTESVDAPDNEGVRYRTHIVKNVQTRIPTTIGAIFYNSDKPEFVVSVEYGIGIKHLIEASKQYLLPYHEQWYDAGSNIKYSYGQSNTFSSMFLGDYDGRYLQTDFTYSQEIWEYQMYDRQKEDWIAVQRWVEVKVQDFKGGSPRGDGIISEKNLVEASDLNSVSEIGHMVVIPAGAKIPITNSSVSVFPVAAKYVPEGLDEYNITSTTMGAEIFYNKGENVNYTYTFDATHIDHEIYVYDYGTDKAFWYVAK